MPTIYASDNTARIYAIDSTTRLVTSLGTTPSAMFDLAMRADGTLFGTDGNSLFTLAIGASGITTTRVGAVGTLPGVNALEFDSTGTLYGLSGSTLFRINTTTGVETAVGTIGGSSAGDLFFLGGTIYASTTAGDLVRGTLAGLAAGGTTQVVQALGSSQVFGIAALTDRVLTLSGNDVARIDQSTAQPVPYANDIIAGQFYGATVEAGANASLQATPAALITTTASVAAGSSRITFLGQVSDTGVFRVDLNGITAGQIRTISLLDDGIISGGTAAASGFDVDFIKYSTTLTSSASTAAGLANSPVFSFTADRVTLTTGFQQPWSSGDDVSWNQPLLFGTTAAGAIDLNAATLGVRDGVNNVATGGGEVSLGEGGRLTLQLVSPITGGYLYVGDVGGGNDGFALLLSESATSTASIAATAFVLQGTTGADTVILGQGKYAGLGAGNDYLDGDSGNDNLNGSAGDDYLIGGSGNDTLNGSAGDDFLDGGTGFDWASFDMAPGAIRIRVISAQLVIDTGGALGTDRLINIEAIATTDGLVTIQADFSGLFRQTAGSDNFMLLGTAYSGPVAGLQRQLLGNATADIVAGTGGADFMNLLGGDDAANGGAGNDVLDGGIGSNFLSGGGGIDTFFLDGRGGTTTWSTITDWQAGEQLSVFGWRPGVSQVTWAASGGAEGYKGVTMFADLDGNGVVETTVTWSGMTQAALPTPKVFDGLLWFVS